uniref:MFS domain-containing protein n=1 Tax=Strongyloides venezuelensis TaxID=75913 RepID=A0A0K0FU59_STRVS
MGRFIIGLQSGCSLSLLPLFINEISFKSETTFLSTFQQISQALSTMIGLIVGSNQILPTKNEYKYLTCQIVAIIPTIVFFFFIAVAPNTPFFIMKKSKNFRSLEKSLIFYRGSTYQPTEHRCLLTQAMDVGKKKDTFLRDGKKLHLIKGILIGCLASISYAFTGDDIVDSYSSTIIITAFPNLRKFWIDMTTVFFSFILLLSSIVGSLVIHKIGTRDALIYGIIGTSFSNFFAFLGNITGTISLTILSFCVSKIFIGICAGGPAWFLMSRLVPPHLASILQAFSTGCILATTGICTFLYPLLNTYFNSYSILMLTMIPELTIAFILYLFLPEVEKKSYQDIEHIFRNYFFSGLSA